MAIVTLTHRKKSCAFLITFTLPNGIGYPAFFVYSSRTFHSKKWKLIYCFIENLIKCSLFKLFIQNLLMFQSTINIIFDRVGKKDPVTRGMEILVHWVGLNIDVTFWSQHISFFLVGCIVVTSIRGLLLTLTKVSSVVLMIDVNILNKNPKNKK